MLSEKLWKIAPQHDLGDLPQKAGVSPLIAQVLANRGITSASDIKSFINPNLNSLSDPFDLPGVNEGAQIIKKAIKEDKKIVVFGDFDVDGITSTALLYEALKKVKADVHYYIPCRFNEGYGLNVNAIKNLSNQGCNLLITVDCGITSFKEIEEAKKMGLQVIVTDHHQAEGDLPPADVLINPVLHGAQYNPAGVGVAYQLARAVTDDNLEEKLELVAIGTIADMVVLRGDNRIIAAEGLSRLQTTSRTGLLALAMTSGLDLIQADTFTVGFGLAPRLNAGGRMGNALKSLELLLTDDDRKAQKISEELDAFNKQRQQVEAKIKKEAREMLSGFDSQKDMAIILSKEGWHEGVKGIVASRIQREYCRPTFICSEVGDLIKGSGRSFGDLNVKEALDKCSDLLENYGGHPAAAGITLKNTNFEEFKVRFNNLAGDFYGDKELKPEIEIEAAISPQEFNTKTLEQLKTLRPFGIGNHEPIFCLENAYIRNQKLLGKKEKKALKFDVQASGKSISSIMFTDKGMRPETESVDVAFCIDENTWQGNTTLQAKINDVRIHEFSLNNPSELVEHLFEMTTQTGRYENIVYSDSFYTKIAGVSFEGRQDLISNLTEGTDLLFVRESTNPHDPNAIRVNTSDGINLGFLNKELAAKLAPYMDMGISWRGEVGSVTGGGNKNHGVNILVKRTDALYSLNNMKKEMITDPVEIKKMLLGDIVLHDKQIEAIESLKKGNNTLLIMGTGRGKSAVFHLHSALLAAQENKITLMLYPLRSLIRDQFMYLEQAMSKVGIGVVKLTGESGVTERREIFESLKDGGNHIVLTTPEFLFHNSKGFEPVKNRIGFFVVDEAHHLQTASMHHRPIYRMIHKLLPEIGNPVTMAATATASTEVATEIVNQLGIEKTVIDPTVRENLFLEDHRGIKNKDQKLASIVEKSLKTVIYMNSREGTMGLADNLRKLLPHLKDKIIYYHAGLNPEMRGLVQDGFMDGTFSTVVATSAFGEGVNISNIKDLVLYHLPFNEVQYNQQCGRAGRDGEPASIHLMFGSRDASTNEFILENICPNISTLRKIYLIIKRFSKSGSFIADNSDILAECETNGVSNLTERGVGSALKVFAELGLINIVKEDGSRIITVLDNGKVNMEDSTLYEEAKNEKEVFADFKEIALKESVDNLLGMFNQPIYPEEWIKGELQKV